jgi:hypothetical protein
MMTRGIDLKWKLAIITNIGIALKIRGVSRRISQSITYRFMARNNSAYLSRLLRNGYSS